MGTNESFWVQIGHYGYRFVIMGTIAYLFVTMGPFENKGSFRVLDTWFYGYQWVLVFINKSIWVNGILWI